MEENNFSRSGYKKKGTEQKRHKIGPHSSLPLLLLHYFDFLAVSQKQDQAATNQNTTSARQSRDSSSCALLLAGLLGIFGAGLPNGCVHVFKSGGHDGPGFLPGQFVSIFVV